MGEHGCRVYDAAMSCKEHIFVSVQIHAQEKVNGWLARFRECRMGANYRWLDKKTATGRVIDAEALQEISIA